ncbi:MAG: hypothetical protein ACYSTR_02595 [Planctomycetota bacterium]
MCRKKQIIRLRSCVVFFAMIFTFCINVHAAIPEANDIEVAVADPNGAVIELIATDDGLPVPPGELSYIITSLPEHGWLFDPGDELEIIESEIPYTLQNDANSVVYEPCPYYFDGTDLFTYKVNDGGSDPNGGDSNIADVNVVMNMQTETIYGDGTTDSLVPFFTQKYKVRSQAIYRASDLNNKAMTISSLALNIHNLPGIEIQNWKIRMKHTTDPNFPSLQPHFDNQDLTVVYSGSVVIDDPSKIVDGWYDFPFQRNFVYDGVSNLLIDFSFDNTSVHITYGQVYNFTTDEYQLISYWSNTGDPLLWENAYNPTDKILFNLKLNAFEGDRLYADFNYNCSVGMEDLLTMIDTWLAQSGDANFNSDCDIIVNSRVDLADYAILASEWLDSMGPDISVYSIADFDESGTVDTEDLMEMIGVWLTQDGDGNYNDMYDISIIDDDKIDLADYAVFASEWTGSI